MRFKKECSFAKVAVLFLLGATCSTFAGAQTWQRLGPQGGLVVSMAGCPSGEVFLGTPDGHVFARAPAAPNQSEPGWEIRGRVSGRVDAVVAALLCSPSGILYAGVWFEDAPAGGGVFRSEDGGRTWASPGLATEAVRALERAPSNPQILVAGTRSGVFRSLNSGKDWQRISPEDDPELRNLDSLAIDPADPQLIYAGTYHLPWKTADGGKTWKSIAAGLIDDSDIMSLRIDSSKPQRIYLSACSGIYRSDTQGELWFKLPGIPYTARRTQAIVQDPAHPQTLYAATTSGLWLSRDAGESWNRTTPADWVVNAVLVPPQATGSSRVLLGTEAQGVLSSSDAGETWSPDNASFTHSVVRELVADPRDSNHLLMLLPRAGSELLESRDAGRTWKAMPLAVTSQSQRHAKLNHGVIERIYASPRGWFLRSDSRQLWFWNDAGDKWTRISLHLTLSTKAKPLRGRNVATAKIPQNEVTWNSNLLEFSGDNFFLFAKEGILRCAPSGSCVPIKTFAASQSVTALQIAADGRSLYVAAANGLAISHDAGTTIVWHDLPPEAGEVNLLDVSPGSDDIFVGTSGGLFHSVDDGVHWILCRGGLPSSPVDRFLRTNGSLFVALREGGLYHSNDQGANWERLDQDAQRGRFTGMVRTAPGVLLLGSQSEGLLSWSANPPN